MKKTIVLLSVMMLVAAGCNSSKTTLTPQNPPTSNGADPKSYTIEDVKLANNASKCWAAIDGKVYDLTNWINQHPGGPARILSICGTDATVAFNTQHAGQRRPANELAGFEIGVLK